MCSVDFFLHIEGFSVASVRSPQEVRRTEKKQVQTRCPQFWKRVCLILFAGHILFHSSSWYVHGKAKAAASRESCWGWLMLTFVGSGLPEKKRKQTRSCWHSESWSSAASHFHQKAYENWVSGRLPWTMNMFILGSRRSAILLTCIWLLYVYNIRYICIW